MRSADNTLIQMSITQMIPSVCCYKIIRDVSNLSICIGGYSCLLCSLRVTLVSIKNANQKK